MSKNGGVGAQQASVGGMSGASTISSIGWRTAQRVVAKNRGLAFVIRKERDERLHRHLLDGGKVAEDEEVQQVAHLLNDRMKEIIIDPLARSWFKLFNQMDDDCSGKVDFHELEDMIRNELRVNKNQLTDDRLKAIWRALDADSSGSITCGEFGAFMRRGLSGCVDGEESGPARLLKKRSKNVQAIKQLAQTLLSDRHIHLKQQDAAKRERATMQKEFVRQVGSSSASKVQEKNAALAAKVRKERDELLHTHLKEGARVATQEEVEEVAGLLNQRMNEIIIDPKARSWFKLFNHMDDDCSGKVNYHELEDMIRNELKVPLKRLSVEQLQALWRALDEDNSGLITCGEFGHFMKHGLRSDEVQNPGMLQMLQVKKNQASSVRHERQQLLRERETNTTALLSARYEKADQWRQQAWGDGPSETALGWRASRAIMF